jgi:P pilus assembly chaperone PapD
LNAPKLLVTVVAVGLGLAAGSGRARAQTLQVSPIQLELTRAAPSEVLTLHNVGAEPTRYQVSAFIAAAPSAQFGAVEKTYRVFVEQLPSAPRARQSGVRVLTRVGIPVYLEPPERKPDAEVSALAVQGRRVSFALRNTGNVRIRPDLVRVVGRDGAGEIVFDQPLSSWYVLAGGERLFEADAPQDGCERVRVVSAEVAVSKGTVEGQLPVAGGACGP